jgi:arginase family enzyme
MKEFNGVRLINTCMTLGRPQVYSNMTSSFSALMSLPRLRHIMNYYKIDVCNLLCDDPDIVTKWRSINRAVKNAFAENRLPIVMNGDHSQAVGSISAAKQTFLDAKVLWIDAHSDIHSITSSESKNMHGMPVSFLSK